jgi:hypothetical protein
MNLRAARFFWRAASVMTETAFASVVPLLMRGQGYDFISRASQRLSKNGSDTGIGSVHVERERPRRDAAVLSRLSILEAS